MRTLSETKRPEGLWPQKQVRRIVRRAKSVNINTIAFLPRKSSTRKTPKVSVKQTPNKHRHNYICIIPAFLHLCEQQYSKYGEYSVLINNTKFLYHCFGHQIFAIFSPQHFVTLIALVLDMPRHLPEKAHLFVGGSFGFLHDFSMVLCQPF